MGVKELLAELNDRDRENVRRITAALQKLEAGRYGICEACGGRIARERLDVMPESQTCIECVR